MVKMGVGMDTPWPSCRDWPNLQSGPSEKDWDARSVHFRSFENGRPLFRGITTRSLLKKCGVACLISEERVWFWKAIKRAPATALNRLRQPNERPIRRGLDASHFRRCPRFICLSCDEMQMQRHSASSESPILWRISSF